ncbi:MULTISPECIES: MraY family glycosyltransferase [Corynebacterium]|uniref:Undecaprenyl/decaprenyl-phosphate alpha-N-acetylglucosaminyl 1-phosphate transferase n=1 Tax=Corynebacterium glucuronolyticum TaxID=39791 RepID=A0A7T4JUL4_9CORY|nr:MULTISPECIES: MraY family glycosyltransferase [Corynebacterium]MCT1441664.1 undecaprenyl/decaprenyl-phosphate alpha-N-acetylglucosaminyl 1-phosphate transferase [Corynebacterium glucuronolyticum]QQB45961.1 undecaprenyl/decaprenyl-phosphate alpha-N-acetylglucosaminyl 1-phosphate transferase [Corynebacterium glucuronolyticum]QQU87577.1 undecaprenyl/decaprenyl-phosphate alpha-N-acetylglucosaminyl 1-phosphate transferase [Corynebacterium glucuronolyticum]QRO83467.1 undecaprenyl/decaprenyl-phosph
MGTAGVGVPLRELGVVLLTALVFTYLTTGIVRSLVIRSGHLSEIRERDVHTVRKPQLGGLAMFTGFLIAVYLAQQLPALTRGFRPITPEMDAILVASAIIVFVGVIDDLYELDALSKLVGQVAAALAMSLMGLRWSILYLPIGDGTTLILDGAQSTILTTVFAVALMNAINFIDGIDGLASGVGMISGLATLAFALSILHDQGGAVAAYPPAIIAAGLVGMCAGFLPHNFAPSRIFMGDTGAMFIGLLLAAASTSASGKINMSLYGTADFIAAMSPIFVVLASVFIPMLDLIMAVTRRLARGQSPFTADRKHLHHRLLRMGHSQKQVVLVLYTWVGVVAFGAVGFTIFPPSWALIMLAVAIAFAVWYTVRPAGLHF